MQTRTNEPAYSLADVKRDAAAAEREKAPQKLIQLVVFNIAGEQYGLPIDQVKEVVLTPRIARMPHTPDYIHGVANIRGNIIAIVDLEQKLGFNKETTDANNIGAYTLVIENEKVKVGVLVKKVPDTLTVDVASIDQATDFIRYTSLAANSLVGVVKAEHNMIMLIDIVKLIDSSYLETDF